MKKIEIIMMDDSHCDINIDGVESKGHFVPAGLMPPEEFALLALFDELTINLIILLKIVEEIFRKRRSNAVQLLLG